MTIDRAIGRALGCIDVARDLCEDRADADCTGDPPRFVPNTWMQVQTLLEEARQELERVVGERAKEER